LRLSNCMQLAWELASYSVQNSLSMCNACVKQSTNQTGPKRNACITTHCVT